MGKNGIKGINELKKLANHFEELDKISGDLEGFFEDCAKALAARLLQRVIKRTPVEENDNYDMRLPSGQMITKLVRGGKLRRGWTGNKDVPAQTWAKSLPIAKVGNSYQITISNPVEYAPYVEYGHRQQPGKYVPQLARFTGNGSGMRLKKSWVPGQYMLEASVNEIKSMGPALVQKMISEFLHSHFKT